MIDRRPVGPDELGGLLRPTEYEVFSRLAAADQRHSLAVMRQLRRRVGDNQLLLRAALLHDVGKSAAPIWLWQRVIFVLVSAWFPALLDWLSRSDAGWRRGFYTLVHHERIGAGLLSRAGVESDIVRLVATPPGEPGDPRRRLLDEADSAV